MTDDEQRQPSAVRRRRVRPAAGPGRHPAARRRRFQYSDVRRRRHPAGGDAVPRHDRGVLHRRRLAAVHADVATDAAAARLGGHHRRPGDDRRAAADRVVRPAHRHAAARRRVDPGDVPSRSPTATASPPTRRRRTRPENYCGAAAPAAADQTRRRCSTRRSRPETMPRPIPGMTPQNGHRAAADQQRRRPSRCSTCRSPTTTPTSGTPSTSSASARSLRRPSVRCDDADQLQVDAFVDRRAGSIGTGDGSPALASRCPAASPPTRSRPALHVLATRSVLNDGFVHHAVPRRDSVLRGDHRLPGPPAHHAASAPASRSPTSCSTRPPARSRPGCTPTRPTRSRSRRSTDDLNFVEGTPSDRRQQGTGEPHGHARASSTTFDLDGTNNGTGNLPDLTVADPLPTGILFDDTFDGDGGQPYTVVWSNLPAGYPSRHPPRCSWRRRIPTSPTASASCSWTFPGWDMPPNAQVVDHVPATRSSPASSPATSSPTRWARRRRSTTWLCTPPDVPVDRRHPCG